MMTKKRSAEKTVRDIRRATCPSRIFVLVDILDEILKQCQPEILVIADVGEDPGS